MDQRRRRAAPKLRRSDEQRGRKQAHDEPIHRGFQASMFEVDVKPAAFDLYEDVG